MIVTAARAAAILYNFLTNRADKRPYLLPGNICPIVPLTFLKAKVPFVFVDLDPETLNMDLAVAEELLRSDEYGGILYAHTYGDETTPVEFFSAIKKAGEMAVIDDRCLCIPAFEPTRENPADMVLYSTGYAKMVDTGFGGYAFLGGKNPYRHQTIPYRQEDLDEIESMYKSSIAEQRAFQYKDSEWLNTAPTPEWESYRNQIQSALPATLDHRKELNAIYESRIPAEICLPGGFQSWRFSIRSERKETILKTLFDHRLFASSHYASLAGIFAPGSCPQAEALAAKVINLFNDHHYTAAMAESTCDIIRKEL